jgi:hypothetical protein
MIIFRNTSCSMNVLQLVLLVPCGVLLGTVTGPEEFLTSEQRQLLSCVETVVTRRLPPGRNLVLSLPSHEQIYNHRTLAPRDYHPSHFSLTETFLKSVNMKSSWPVLISRPSDRVSYDLIPHKHHVFIIFLWPDEEQRMNGTLESQMENLVEYLDSFNRRGKFIVVASCYEKCSSKHYAKEIIETMWKGYRITNVIVIIPNTDRFITKSALIRVNDKERSSLLSVYSWSAYESGQCGEVNEVRLLDEWLVNDESQGRFRENMTRFPSNFPQNVHGCPITVSTVHFPPFVIMTTNNTDEKDIKYRGIDMEFLFLLSEVMNMTLEFRPRPERELTSKFISAFSEAVLDGISDVAIGLLWLHPFLTAYGEPTIPYWFTSVQWFVPCPTPAIRVQKIRSMFAPSVWLLMVVVIIMTAVLFWTTSRMPGRPNTSLSLLDGLESAWAIFMSKSVPKLPGSNLFRTVFLIYVCYCFVMNTVFQSFFITYLAEPGYGAQIKTMKELSESSLILYIPDFVKKYFFFASYEPYYVLKLPLKTAPNYRESFRRLISENDVATVGLPLIAEYLAAMEGKFGKYSEYVCTLDGSIFDLGVSMYFAKGNPLLSRANVVIRRCFEAGLVQKYTSELMWNTCLRNSAKLLERKVGKSSNSGSKYFVFTLFHMRLAFLILTAGYVGSFVIFFAEFAYKYYSKPVVNKRNYSGL